MPTPSGRARPGDVFAIPLEGDLQAFVKVVYVSRYFRNVIGIAVASSTSAAAPQSLEYPTDWPILYTAQVCSKEYWQFLRTEAVSEADNARTRRIVAGDLFLGDTRVRPATPEDRRLFSQMGVLGCAGVIDSLRRRFSLSPIPRP